MSLPENMFYDINRLPKGWGILLFPISMSRITNSQNAEACLEYLLKLNKKIVEPKVGVTFVYGDYLYFHSQEPAAKLKARFQELVIDHKNAVMNLLLGKYRNDFQITPAFTFATWNQLYLWSDNFKGYFDRIKKLARQDDDLQKYLAEDAVWMSRPLSNDQENFILEESLMSYLVTKGKLNIYNEYVHNREEWLLWCYPGIPPKTEVYLAKKNPFNLKNPSNKFDNAIQYDLDSNRLFTVDNFNIDSWNYE